MAPRQYADIPRFRMIEASLREATGGFDPALREIERALAGRRGEAEIAMLEDVRDHTRQARQQAQQLVHRLYTGNV